MRIGGKGQPEIALVLLYERVYERIEYLRRAGGVTMCIEARRVTSNLHKKGIVVAVPSLLCNVVSDILGDGCICCQVIDQGGHTKRSGLEPLSFPNTNVLVDILGISVSLMFRPPTTGKEKGFTSARIDGHAADLATTWHHRKERKALLGRNIGFGQEGVDVLPV